MLIHLAVTREFEHPVLHPPSKLPREQSSWTLYRGRCVFREPAGLGFGNPIHSFGSRQNKLSSGCALVDGPKTGGGLIFWHAPALVGSAGSTVLNSKLLSRALHPPPHRFGPLGHSMPQGTRHCRREVSEQLDLAV